MYNNINITNLNIAWIFSYTLDILLMEKIKVANSNKNNYFTYYFCLKKNECIFRSFRGIQRLFLMAPTANF